MLTGGRLEQRFVLEHLELAILDLQVPRELDQLLLLPLDRFLTVQLLLLQLVLQQLNLFQLSVELQLKIVDQVPEMPRFILQLFVFNLERDYSLRVVSALLDGFRQLSLQFFKLLLEAVGVALELGPVTLNFLQLFLEHHVAFVARSQAFFKVNLALFEFAFVVIHHHWKQQALCVRDNPRDKPPTATPDEACDCLMMAGD